MTTITALPITSCVMDGENTFSVPITPATTRAGMHERIYEELNYDWAPDTPFETSPEAFKKAINELLADMPEFPFVNTFPNLAVPDGYLVIELSPNNHILCEGYTDDKGVFMSYNDPQYYSHRSCAIWAAITHQDSEAVDDLLEFYNFTVTP